MTCPPAALHVFVHMYIGHHGVGKSLSAHLLTTNMTNIIMKQFIHSSMDLCWFCTLHNAAIFAPQVNVNFLQIIFASIDLFVCRSCKCCQLVTLLLMSS